MSDQTRCQYCNRRWDRPASPGCVEGGHEPHTLPDRIVAEIEADLNDRRGLGIDTLDDDIQDDIRDKWVELIKRVLVEEPCG
jgi:hypothetical protein